MIRIRGLQKGFDTRLGRVEAVHGIELDVAEREFCVLLGPSGCGKTTTLRCVAGLELPDEGEIELAGKLVYSGPRRVFVPPERRDIGMVFQSYALWPHMTVHQVVAYPLTDGRKRFSKREVEDRVRGALELVQLGGLDRRPVTDLSGGQQQRVALARALVTEPPVLLMDEPLSNLDARLREEMRSEIKRLTTRLGVTTLYVTHDQTEALSLADRVCVMRLGEIADSGTPEQIYLAPRNRYAAQFVGHMIFVPGRVGEAAAVESGLGRVRCQLPEGFGPGDAVVLGMRPEHVGVGSERGNDGLTVEGEVLQRLFLGDGVVYEVQVGDATLSVKLPIDLRASTGDRLCLRFPSDRWHVFPADQSVQSPGLNS